MSLTIKQILYNKQIDKPIGSYVVKLMICIGYVQNLYIIRIYSIPVVHIGQCTLFPSGILPILPDCWACSRCHRTEDVTHVHAALAV